MTYKSNVDKAVAAITQHYQEKQVQADLEAQDNDMFEEPRDYRKNFYWSRLSYFNIDLTFGSALPIPFKVWALPYVDRQGRPAVIQVQSKTREDAIVQIKHLMGMD